MRERVADTVTEAPPTVRSSDALPQDSSIFEMSLRHESRRFDAQRPRLLASFLHRVGLIRADLSAEMHSPSVAARTTPLSEDLAQPKVQVSVLAKSAEGQSPLHGLPPTGPL